MVKDRPKSDSTSFGRRHPWRWVLLAFAAMVATGLVTRHRWLPHPLEGQPLPGFVATHADGDPALFQPPADRVIILEFWASWCVPCMVSLPRLEALHAWIQSADVAAEIYCINVGETSDRAREVWSAKRFTMPLLSDPDGAIAETFDVVTLPTTVLAIDGRVEQVHVGSRRTQLTAMKQRITAMLETAASPP